MTFTTHEVGGLEIETWTGDPSGVSISDEEGVLIYIEHGQLDAVITALQDCKRVLDLVVASL